MASPSNPPQRKLRIAIIGGGIGGLACAVALKDCKNIELDVYEAAASITEIGAGITVWPRTWRILKSMGLEEALLKGLKDKPVEEPRIGFTFRKGDQKDGFTFHQMIMNVGSLPFHRKDVQQALLGNLPPTCKIHLEHRLVQCEENSEGAKLHFANGKIVDCDLAVGADGIKSVVRRHLRTQSLSPNNNVFYTGTVAYRGLIPREKLADLHPGHRTLDEPVIYCGKGRHIVVYPISQGRIINVVAFYSKLTDEGKPLPGPEVRDATVAEILEVYSGWETEVQQLLSCIENPTCWVIQDLTPLDTYISSKTLLLGDAAHAMTPHLGAGAGQAMEDAYILGAIISKSPCTVSAVPYILKAYDAIRKPFGNYILSTARKQGFYYEFNAPEFQDIKEPGQTLSPEQLSILMKTVTNNWRWAWQSAEEDHKRAVAML